LKKSATHFCGVFQLKVKGKFESPFTEAFQMKIKKTKFRGEIKND
jgi:hypothetical protein